MPQEDADAERRPRLAAAAGLEGFGFLVHPYPRSQIDQVPSVVEIDTEILRRMTPERKLAVMHALWIQAWELKAAGIRLRHPDWTDEQVEDRVRALFRDAGP